MISDGKSPLVNDMITVLAMVTDFPKSDTSRDT